MKISKQLKLSKKWKVILIALFLLIFNIQVFKAALYIIEEKQRAAIVEPSLEIAGELKNAKALQRKIYKYPIGYKEYAIVFEKEDGTHVELKGLSSGIMKMIYVGDVVSLKYTDTNHIKEIKTIERIKKLEE